MYDWDIPVYPHEEFDYDKGKEVLKGLVVDLKPYYAAYFWFERILNPMVHVAHWLANIKGEELDKRSISLEEKPEKVFKRLGYFK